MSAAEEAAGTHRPALRVVHGDATPEELAAVLALVAARRGTAAAEAVAAERVSLWSAPSGAHRRSRSAHHAHRHGWRTSSWPH